MYNILINNLSLVSGTAKTSTYLLNIKEVKNQSRNDWGFERIYTNGPVTHVLIRKCANEEHAEHGRINGFEL